MNLSLKYFICFFFLDINMFFYACIIYNSPEYPIASIEEPFDKDDWEHTKLFSALGICQVPRLSINYAKYISLISFLRQIIRWTI